MSEQETTANAQQSPLCGVPGCTWCDPVTTDVCPRCSGHGMVMSWGGPTDCQDCYHGRVSSAERLDVENATLDAENKALRERLAAVEALCEESLNGASGTYLIHPDAILAALRSTS